jgi:hypothetical protein
MSLCEFDQVKVATRGDQLSGAPSTLFTESLDKTKDAIRGLRTMGFEDRASHYTAVPLTRNDFLMEHCA